MPSVLLDALQLANRTGFNISHFVIEGAAMAQQLRQLIPAQYAAGDGAASRAKRILRD